jgi:hypothetical protein
MPRHRFGAGFGAARTLKLSPARRASLKLQGQYMGYLRGLGVRQKARVKAVRTKKGIRPAIAMAKRFARLIREEAPASTVQVPLGASHSSFYTRL